MIMDFICNFFNVEIVNVFYVNVIRQFDDSVLLLATSHLTVIVRSRANYAVVHSTNSDPQFKEERYYFRIWN